MTTVSKRISCRQCLQVLACLVLAVVVGCGQGNPRGRRAISGRVTLDGQPLDAGNIRFLPQEADGVGSGAVIANGEHRLDKLQGLPPGTYRVQIFATGDALPPEEIGIAGGFPPPGTERIPPQYNTASTLTIEVAERGSTTFDFDLTSQ